MGRFSQFAVAATREAIQNADLDLDKTDRHRVGVLLGNGIGSISDTQTAVKHMTETGDWKIDPFFFPKMLPNMAAAHVSLMFGAKGYSNTVITACAAGTQAIGDSLDVIRAGRADMVITGGAEAALSQVGLGGFAVIRALSSRNDDPHHASRPFDAERDGFIAAEGAGIFILENLEHARKRNAPILAEVAGYGSTNDANHAVRRAPMARSVLTMQLALADANVEPAEVDYVNAHDSAKQRRRRDGGDQAHVREDASSHPGELHEIDGRALWRRRSHRIGRRRAGDRHGDDPPDSELRVPGPGMRPGLRAQ
jgi:3-oxoacyl-[acyl-carrier-protein] synthase II